MPTKPKAHLGFKPIFFAVCYLFILLTLFLTNNGISLLRTVGVFFFLAASVFLPQRMLFELIVLLQPFTSVFRLGEGLTVMPFLILVFIVKAALTSRGRLFGDAVSFALFFALFTISIVAHSLWFSSFTGAIPFFIYLLFFHMAITSEQLADGKVFDGATVVFVISALLFCVCIGLFPNAVSQIAPMSETGIDRAGGFTTVWEFGRILVVAVSLIIVRLLMNHRHLIVYIAVMLYFLYWFVQTGLFSGLVSLIIIAVLLPFSVESLGAAKKRYISVLMLFGSVILLLLGYKYIYEPMNALRGGMNDNGRFQIWSQYLGDLAGNVWMLLFGIGGGAISVYAESVSRLTAHNIVIEKLVELGLVGIVLLVLFLKQSFAATKVSLSLRKNLHVIPLIAYLGTCLTQGTSGSELIFLVMILSCIPQTNEKEIADAPKAPPRPKQKG